MTTQRPDSMAQLADAQHAADGIMALEGFEASPGVQALDAAMLAGRATMDEVLTFLKLHAAITGAESVLAAIGVDDPRYSLIAARKVEQCELLRNMAINMDGAVRVAFDL
jgi:hypothetical protein